MKTHLVRQPVLFLLAICSMAACSRGSPPLAANEPLKGVDHTAAAARPPVARRTVITIIGTNDLHGHLDALPVFAGYLTILRNLRAKDGGVVLLDAGDMFQGTLESNLYEGAPVVEVYNLLGYHGAAIGNHEFDYGPVGPSSTPKTPEDDPVGALKARAAEARFPLLGANIREASSGAPVTWKNVFPSRLIEVAGVKVGIIGATTESTPETTNSINVKGLRFTALGPTVAEEVSRLRRDGAELLVLTVHAGAKCRTFTDPHDSSSCTQDEITHAAKGWPTGFLHAVVSGHTHGGMAHYVNDIPIIQSFARGVAFGRIDVEVVRTPGKPIAVHSTVYPPRSICKRGVTPCRPDTYEGREIVPDAEVAKVVANHLAQADKARSRKLGVTITAPLTAVYDRESQVGNLVVDLMLAARPSASVAITNGGGLRADIPVGQLTYGQFYEVIPFDNRFAILHMTGGQLRELIRQNLMSSRGILSVGGFRVAARCQGGKLQVELRRPHGKRIDDNQQLTVATSDFLATGGDGAIARLGLPKGAIFIEDGEPLRDVITRVLEKKGGELSGADPALFDPKKPRVDLPGPRPVKCQ
jgi:5'-nucleotidase